MVRLKSLHVVSFGATTYLPEAVIRLISSKFVLQNMVIVQNISKHQL